MPGVTTGKPSRSARRRGTASSRSQGGYLPPQALNVQFVRQRRSGLPSSLSVAEWRVTNSGPKSRIQASSVGTSNRLTDETSTPAAVSRFRTCRAVSASLTQTQTRS